MHEVGKSDSPVLPAKPSNKAVTAEMVEGRGLTKGNTDGTTGAGRRAGGGLSQGLDRVRQAAKRDKEARFTALLHHVDVDGLREAYRAINPKAAAGADGVTWEAYGENLEGNLLDLHRRLHSGAYRAKPVRRAFIPKADGRQRSLGIASLEDKIVQGALVKVLNGIYEADFLGFSYGFRPRRGPHQALDALTVGIKTKKVNWVLDADVADFFTSLDRGWLAKFLEHRIADERVLRIIQKWLKAGVIENGNWAECDAGTPQGATASPLLANVYLHYVFDLWAERWRRREARGDVIIVRYADDFIVGFEHQEDAERFLAGLVERFAKFGLELKAEKTRLIEFGRFAARKRKAGGLGKPETFDFLGFTHICGKTRGGQFQVLRITISKRSRTKLRELSQELKRRRHLPIPEQGKWLRSVVLGHRAYYAVPGNLKVVSRFVNELKRLWLMALRRRSQKTRMTWHKFAPLAARWMPPIRNMHPYPEQRFAVAHPR
ncbi:MAG: group II intron reverse transcriptase/maturase [Actinomycetota bacterium]|nr:group II intron reverse transcriptase/maturase [Actinomycetota bacterium]